MTFPLPLCDMEPIFITYGNLCGWFPLNMLYVNSWMCCSGTENVVKGHFLASGPAKVDYNMLHHPETWLHWNNNKFDKPQPNCSRQHTCSKTQAVSSPTAPLDRWDTHPGLGSLSGRRFQPPGPWLVGSRSQKQQKNHFPSGGLLFGVNHGVPPRSVSPQVPAERNLEQSYF